MIFCADIGNKSIKCGVLNETTTLSRERIATPAPAENAELGNVIRRAAGVALDFRAAIISSVVPEVTRAVSAAIFESIALRPMEVSHEVRLPLELALPVPSRLGADRICAAAGAIDEGRRDAIIIDAGSAVTVDLVREGRFLGGVIMPGPRAALFALRDNASQLPRIDYAEQTDRFPENFDATEPAMVLGVSLGAVGGITEGRAVAGIYRGPGRAALSHRGRGSRPRPASALLVDPRTRSHPAWTLPDCRAQPAPVTGGPPVILIYRISCGKSLQFTNIFTCRVQISLLYWWGLALG